MTTEKQSLAVNKIGLEKRDYTGSASTLCIGCGHDQITNHIITALFQLGVDPSEVAKMSGIGCSSKTPAYFLGKSFGVNSLHGRMAPMATGSVLANPLLKHIGISGDGDTASIGLTGFAHLVRRNVPMVYIVANNGVYGLTKGQFSATSDKGSKLKTGQVHAFETLDICTLAIDLGCHFVARSFSGDMKQLVPLIKAAFKHKGTALIDVISPCVTFNNHDGSTKSFTYLKEHDVALQELGFIEPREEIQVEYEEGQAQEVSFPDGSKLVLKKLDSQSHDIHDSLSALEKIYEARKKGQILTGLFYIQESSPSLGDILNQNLKKPLSEYRESELRGDEETLHRIMRKFQ
jgi:2-oxoglutarate/2-oxoacid ferredoxin oxidoreductase subunit beta